MRRQQGDPGGQQLVWNQTELDTLQRNFDQEIRKVVYTTNMIESLNARFRQATRRRGHFPSEQAVLKVLYLVIQDKQSKTKRLVGRINGWKKALNAFALLYADRIAEN